MSPKQDQNSIDVQSFMKPISSAAVVDWSSSGFAVTPSHLQSLFDSCGMSISVAPINPSSVVKNRSSYWKKSYKNNASENNDYVFQTRIVSSSKDSNHIVVALCYWNIAKGTTSNLNTANATTIDHFVWDLGLEKWSNKSSWLQVDSSAPADVQYLQEHAIRARKAYMGHIRHEQKYIHTTSLYHNYLKPFILSQCNGLSVFRGKGKNQKPYLIPVESSEGFEKLCKFSKAVENLGFSFSFLCPNQQSAENMVQESLSSMIDDLQDRMVKWSTDSKKIISGDELNDRIEEFKELESLSGLFGDILQVKIKKLDHNFAKCQEAIDKAIEYQNVGCSPTLIKCFSRLIEKYDDGDIVGFEIKGEDLRKVAKVKVNGKIKKTAILPASCLNNTGYFCPSGLGGKALSHLGYKATLVERKDVNYDDDPIYDLWVYQIESEESEANS